MGSLKEPWVRKWFALLFLFCADAAELEERRAVTGVFFRVSTYLVVGDGWRWCWWLRGMSCVYFTTEFCIISCHCFSSFTSCFSSRIPYRHCPSSVKSTSWFLLLTFFILSSSHVAMSNKTRCLLPARFS